MAAHFYRIHDALERDVRNRVAREVPIDRSVTEGGPTEQKWFEHIASGEVWHLVWPDFEGRACGSFSRVRFTPYPIWVRRSRGWRNAEPFWRRGAALEHDEFNNDTERNEFSAWLDVQLARGHLRRVAVPEAVIERSMGYPWTWLLDTKTGATWQFSHRGIMPLELPPSLEAYRPKLQDFSD